MEFPKYVMEIPEPYIAYALTLIKNNELFGFWKIGEAGVRIGWKGARGELKK